MITMTFILKVLAFFVVLNVFELSCGAVFSRSQELRELEWDIVRRSIPGYNKNAVMSPFSIDVVLSLIFEGLHPRSPEFIELKRLYPELGDRAQFRRNFKATLDSMKRRAPTNNLKLATRYYQKQQLRRNVALETIYKNYYQTEVMNLNPNNNIPEFVRGVNQWCSDVTNGNLQNLLSENDLSFNTILLIINAIYFKGEWKQYFQDVIDGGVFNSQIGPVFNVTYMEQIGTFNYHESKSLNAKILSLPYKNDNISMYFVLPTDRKSLGSLVRRLNLKVLDQLESSMEPMKVFVALPKFKFTYTTDVKQVLDKLNIRNVFSRLGSFEIKQKAGISIDEKGTEAFAATSAVMNRIGGGASFKVFDANRPFLFYIKDSETNRILFAGKVMNPKL